LGMTFSGVRKTAVIIGASSGIGEALARQLAKEGWRVVLAARRRDRLETLAAEIGHDSIARYMDLAEPEAAARLLEEGMTKWGAIDLVVISSGIGHLNPTLDAAPDRETIAVNVTGFAAVAQVAMRHFLKRKAGHLVGITSIAALRGSGDAASYAASKAFQSRYLDGLRDKAKQAGARITVTEAQPGYVDTAMMKADHPFWVASPEKAAAQILAAVKRRAKHVYITRRWGMIAFLLRGLPRPG